MRIKNNSVYSFNKALRSEKNDIRKSVIKELPDWSGAGQKPSSNYKNLTFLK